MSQEQLQEQMQPEQAADAAAIEALVQGEGGAAGQVQEQEQAAPKMPPEVALAGLLSMIGIAADVADMPRVAAIWQPEPCTAFADRAVPVMVKYPWGQRILAFVQDGAGVEEMAFAVVAVPMLLATIKAAKVDLAKEEKKPEPAAPVPAVVPFSPAGNATMMETRPEPTK